MTEQTSEPKVSWGPAAKSWAQMSRKRYMREEIIRSSWIIAGVVLILAMVNITFGKVEFVRQFAGTIYMVIAALAVLAAVVHGFYIAFRRHTFSVRINGAKAGLWSTAVSVLSIVVGALLGKLAIFIGFGLITAIALILTAFAVTFAVETKNIDY